MSTRALYSFVDEHGIYHVYKHSDNYPTGAAQAIARAIDNAWTLPRFEADEFGAAFIAANKSRESIAARNPDTPMDSIKRICQGGIRLVASGKWQDVAMLDIRYRYEISCVGGELIIKAFAVSCDMSNEWNETELFNGRFEEFKHLAVELDKV